MQQLVSKSVEQIDELVQARMLMWFLSARAMDTIVLLQTQSREERHQGGEICVEEKLSCLFNTDMSSTEAM